MPAHWALRFLGLGLLIAVNGFFVAAEFALVTLEPARLLQLQSRPAMARRPAVRALVRLRERLDLALSAVQLGVTLSGLGLGWAAGPSLAALLHRLLPASTTPPPRWLDGLLVAAGFLIITGVDIVAAEIVPKRLALQQGERMALGVAIPMSVFVDATRPLLQAIATCATWILHLLGVAGAMPGEYAHSPEELKLLARASLRRGELQPLQEEVIRRVLDLGRVPVREIMTPRPQVQALPLETTLAAAWAFFASNPRTRVPVYRGDVDHLAGVLNAKDVLRALPAPGSPPAGGEANGVRRLLRPLPIIPESKPVDALLREFQRGGRTHMAAVVDEFGTFSGLVTIEDALEQIVGEVVDEFETPPRAATPGGGEYDALTPIRDIEAELGLHFPRDDAYETLAGFVLSRLRRLPQGGERLAWEGHQFTVTAVQDRRIVRVRIDV